MEGIEDPDCISPLVVWFDIFHCWMPVDSLMLFVWARRYFKQHARVRTHNTETNLLSWCGGALQSQHSQGRGRRISESEASLGYVWDPFLKKTTKQTNKSVVHVPPGCVSPVLMRQFPCMDSTVLPVKQIVLCTLFCFEVWEIGLRAFCVLCRYSATQPHPQIAPSPDLIGCSLWGYPSCY